jgi:hypothetical protein
MTLLLRAVAVLLAVSSIEIIYSNLLIGPPTGFGSTTAVTRLLLCVPAAVTLIGAAQLWRLKQSGLLISRILLVLVVLLTGALTLSSGDMDVGKAVGFAIAAALLVLLFSPAARRTCAR